MTILTFQLFVNKKEKINTFLKGKIKKGCYFLKFVIHFATDDKIKAIKLHEKKLVENVFCLA